MRYSKEITRFVSIAELPKLVQSTMSHPCRVEELIVRRTSSHAVSVAITGKVRKQQTNSSESNK